MLYFNLRPVCSARGIENPLQFLIKSGFTYHSAKLLLRSNYRQPRLDHIELLCKALVCTPNDILAWKPDTDAAIPKEHPLHTLAPKAALTLHLNELRNVSLNKLSRIQDLITAELNSTEIS